MINVGGFSIDEFPDGSLSLSYVDKDGRGGMDKNLVFSCEYRGSDLVFVLMSLEILNPGNLTWKTRIPWVNSTNCTTCTCTLEVI